MHNPPHPGLLLADGIESMGLTQAEAAAQIGINRVTLSRVLNGHSAITPTLALRLEHWLGAPDGQAEFWIRMQIAHDMWQARVQYKRDRPKVRRAPRMPLAA